jgi:hypothetical protein
VNIRKRRGTATCASGTCQQVPDVGGLELRVLSRY